VKISKDEYKDYLINVAKLSEITANTYINRLRYYYKNNKVLDDKKSKNYINQTKNAIKYLYKMNDIYYSNETIDLSKIHDSMKHKKPVKIKLKLSTTNKKINGLKDKRKKLAYRLQEVSGLRISEISNLTKNDITFENGKIYITVIDGKGNKDRRVATIKDKYLYKELPELEERKGKLFHKENTLRKKAWELGFKTHKLRKVTAKYLNLKYPAKNEDERREFIQKVLGHNVDKRNRTYKRYIDQNDIEIDVSGTRFDI